MYCIREELSIDSNHITSSVLDYITEVVRDGMIKRITANYSVRYWSMYIVKDSPLFKKYSIDNCRTQFHFFKDS